jgi:N-acetylglutamate synthase-like GNAT family acetyltransferase
MAAPEKKIQVRKATVLDAVNIYRLLAEGKKSSAIPGEMDPAKSINFILDLMQRGYVLVAELSGRIIASMGFSVFKPPHTDEFICDGEWYYVQPNFRDTGVGQALLQRLLKQMADKVDIRMALCERDVTEFKEEFLAKLGFDPTARQYIRKHDGRRQSELDADDETTGMAELGE